MSTLTTLNEFRRERKKLCDEAGKLLTKASLEKRDLTGYELQNWHSCHEQARKIFERNIKPLEEEYQRESSIGIDGLPSWDKRMGGMEETRGGGDTVSPGWRGDYVAPDEETPARDPALSR